MKWSITTFTIDLQQKSSLPEYAEMFVVLVVRVRSAAKFVQALGTVQQTLGHCQIEESVKKRLSARISKIKKTPNQRLRTLQVLVHSNCKTTTAGVAVVPTLVRPN